MVQMETPYDISPEDIEAREAFAARLKDMRKARGFSQQALGIAAVGSRHRVHDAERTSNWRIRSLQEWVRIFDHCLVMTTHGLPEVDDDIDLMILEMAKPKDRQDFDRLHRIAVHHYLIAARVKLGVTATEMARIWNRDVDTVGAWETADYDNYMVYTLQRYARALGGRLQFDIGDYPEGLA